MFIFRYRYILIDLIGIMLTPVILDWPATNTMSSVCHEQNDVLHRNNAFI